MSKKTLLKISNKLLNHDSIINAITTKGMKYVLTLECGNFFYWVRFYENGENKSLKEIAMWDKNNYVGAYNYFTQVRAKLRKQGLKLFYNTYDDNFNC